jgi:hypothetical protein
MKSRYLRLYSVEYLAAI